MVGPNNTYYQRDLDRKTIADYTVRQRRHILGEPIIYNTSYRERGCNTILQNVLYMTADMYTQVWAQFVKSIQIKQTIPTTSFSTSFALEPLKL